MRCLPRALSLTSSARLNKMKPTTTDGLRVIPSRPQVLGKMQIYLICWCRWFWRQVRIETMVVYLELSTSLRVRDEYCSAIEQFQNHVGTIPSGAQLPREELEARVVKPDLVVDIEWSSSDVSVVEGLGFLLVDRRASTLVVPGAGEVIISLLLLVRGWAFWWPSKLDALAQPEGGRLSRRWAGRETSRWVSCMPSGMPIVRRGACVPNPFHLDELSS